MLASIGAAGATLATPAFAAGPGAIEALWPEYLRLQAALYAVSERVMDAEECYEEPDLPRWHPFTSGGGYVTIQTSPGRGFAVLDDEPENVAHLKALAAKVHDLEEARFALSGAGPGPVGKLSFLFGSSASAYCRIGAHGARLTQACGEPTVRKMKSKFVRVKVWYEHEEGLPATNVSAAIDQLVLACLTKRDGDGVRVHSFQVGEASPPPARPTPDF